MASKHRIAVIGLGIMGRRLLANLRDHPAFDPVAIWDPSGTACDRARAETPGVPVMASAEEAMAAADAVYLACPPVPRKDYALTAAAAGKGVFLEKPLGIDIGESRDLVLRLAQATVPAAVNFTQAASRALAEVQRALAAGEMGALQGIDIIVTYPAWPRAWQIDADWLRFRAEGGFTREVISHFLFFSERVIGPLTLVAAHPSYPADPALCESHVMARLETKAGVPVTILGSVGGAQPDRQEVTIKGAKRSYRIAEFYQLWSSEGETFTEILERPTDPRQSSLQLQLDELDKCLRRQPHLLATPEEALSVQENIEGILTNISN